MNLLEKLVYRLLSVYMLHVEDYNIHKWNCWELYDLNIEIAQFIYSLAIQVL